MRKMLLLVTLLLAACSSAPSPTIQPTDPGATAGPTAPAAQTAGPTGSPAAEWRVLGEGLWLPELPFAVRVALGEDAFARLWTELSQPDPPPAVDFEREVVLYMGISGSSSCPNVLEGLVVDHQNARVFGQWRVHEGRACTDDLTAQGVLLAVERALLPADVFLLSLQERSICPDCPDHLFVDPSATGSR